MQFAGQRTNERLEPIGEPDNILVKLPDDVIPEPDAILVHGITPQQTLGEGLTEAEFAAFFHEKIATAETVFVGFNNIRFDDEFIRKVCYRTMYDPYQWHWKDGRGRWDLLDPIRMMRALRPDGLKWPMINGKATVKLELMARENGLDHDHAHDALSDVMALIQLAQLFYKHQPRLFTYLLGMKDKKAVAKLVEADSAFVYTSGRYDSAFDKTTVVKTLFKHPRREAAVVYDLRYDPTPWYKKTPEELIKHWKPAFGEEIEKLPVKTLQYNRCPAIAPTSVLDKTSKERLRLDDAVLQRHARILADDPKLIENLQKALDIMEKAQQTQFDLGSDEVDDQMYSGFWNDADINEMVQIRMAPPAELVKIGEQIRNRRLREMLPLYKARNYPESLTAEEREVWEKRRRKVFYGGGDKSAFARFSKRMQQLGADPTLTSEQEYLLTELQLYIESIVPEPEV